MSATLLLLLLLPCVVWSLSSSLQMNNNRVAVVTGASRGIGRGIALELGGQGYTVYCLGRSSRRTSLPPAKQRAVADGLDVTVESAAEHISNNSGKGIPITCDLSQDGVIEDVLDRVMTEQGRLDVLVCAAYTTPPENLRADFWTQVHTFSFLASASLFSQ